ncbi:hypothetical protein Ga0466249_000377 [Sporomusaceae bacterium BoRhaA]|nr:hypothetical protein [Pelorhabdus rhamnosifermentans]
MAKRREAAHVFLYMWNLRRSAVCNMPLQRVAAQKTDRRYASEGIIFMSKEKQILHLRSKGYSKGELLKRCMFHAIPWQRCLKQQSRWILMLFPAWKKKDVSRASAFEEEFPFMQSFPPYSYEFAQWKTATVQLNYHIKCKALHLICGYTIIIS